jgi:prepilin-type processing-associated H-X9-DG protein
VQQVREAASCTACRNNLRQLGLAVQHYVHDFRCFPTNGGPAPGQVNVIATNGGYWGLGNRNARPSLQTGCWAYSILPHLEQQNVVAQDDQGAALRMFLCPTRGRMQPQTVPDYDDVFKSTYVSGGRNPWTLTDYAANWYLIVNRWPAGGCPVAGPPLTPAQVRDGTANTLLLGEKAMDPREYDLGTWFHNEPIFSGGSDGTARRQGVITRDTVADDFPWNWGSAHPGGCQFVFADGSVRTLRYATPPDTVLALMTPAGGEVVGPED